MLFLGRKAVTNLGSVLKSRIITLLTKVHVVKAVIFPIVMYRCVSWTIKKAEHLKSWCFWTVVLDKTLESPLDSKEVRPVNPKGNQLSNLNIHWKDSCWSWSSNTLATWVWRDNSLEKALMLGKSEKAMAPNSSTLAWKIPWTEEPGRLWSIGLLRVGHNWVTSLYFSLSCIGEGNGNPLQCSCLENPRDGGAWWGAIYGVTQNRTQLKWLSSTNSWESLRARGEGIDRGWGGWMASLIQWTLKKFWASSRR